MKPEDLPAFTELLDATCGLLSRNTYAPNDTATGLFFGALRAYSLAEVRGAFQAHMMDPQRGRFVPTPADLIAQLQASQESDGRPGPEVAWTIAVEATSEDATVVWTAEIAQAWGDARILAGRGDEVAARMAFKESYTALVAQARAARQPMRWDVAVGLDRSRAPEALRRALALGRDWRQHKGDPTVTTGAEDLLTLPAPQAVPALLLTGPEQAAMPEKAREALMALAERMRVTEAAPMSPDAEARERTAELQRQSVERVARYGLAHGIAVSEPAPVEAAQP